MKSQITANIEQLDGLWEEIDAIARDPDRRLPKLHEANVPQAVAHLMRAHELLPTTLESFRTDAMRENDEYHQITPTEVVPVSDEDALEPADDVEIYRALHAIYISARATLIAAHGNV